MIFPLSVAPQSVCPIKTVKARSLGGQVVENVGNENPWPGVSVDVRDKAERLLATQITDEMGRFGFDQITKGKYFLEFRSNQIPTYRLVVELRERKESSKGGGIVLKLDLDCGKTRAMLGK